MPRASAITVRRARRSACPRCRRGCAWRSNASRSASSRRPPAASAPGDVHRARSLGRWARRPRVRDRARAVRDLRTEPRHPVSGDAPIRVVGTAGHVDHGKSTLIEALTGIDPDRLREEKERGMTIDLGFAWLTLPSGREISIVDVPGHERFIKNMLAGVGGIDAALLVVAADEGIMPQTREHLAILNLLGIDCGLVALTKKDLVDDEWLALVREEIAETLQGTTLAGAAVVPVSALARDGLDTLE